MLMPIARSLLAQDRIAPILWGILVPSGVVKMVYPQPLEQLWPTIPTWVWRPTGAWEAASIVAATTTIGVPGSSVLRTVGLAASYMYMGAVTACILRVPDGPDHGHTHVSGKGPLGIGGTLLLIPATVTVWLLARVGQAFFSAAAPGRHAAFALGFGALGFGIALRLDQSSATSHNKQRSKDGTTKML